MHNFLFTPGITLITANEELIAVYGARLLKPTKYGDHKYVTRINLRYRISYLSSSIVRLSFVVADSSGDVPTTAVYGEFLSAYISPFTTKIVTDAAGKNKDAFEKFKFTWGVAGASSYTLQPRK
jgi:hypothetical protein